MDLQVLLKTKQSIMHDETIKSSVISSKHGLQKDHVRTGTVPYILKKIVNQISDVITHNPITIPYCNITWRRKKHRWHGHKLKVTELRNWYNETVFNTKYRAWLSLLITLYLICVESLYRYQKTDVQRRWAYHYTTMNRTICYPPTYMADWILLPK